MCINPNPDNEPREHQYTALVNVRNTELSAYWTRYNIQVVLNLGLVVACLSAKSDSIIGKHLSWVSLCGILLAIIWLCFAIKSKQLFTNRWEGHIKKYEAEFLPDKHRLFTNVCTEEEQKTCLRKNWDNLNILALSVPVFLILIWAIIGINAYPSPFSSEKEQAVLELKSKMETLSSENDRIKSDIEQIKNQLIDLNKGIRSHSTNGSTNPTNSSRHGK